MLDEISRYLKKPELYEKSASFWVDEHISKGLLAAHLNPAFDAASRRPEFMDRSAEWITKIAPPADYRNMLDLGCGPGLYSGRFFDAGYSVVGVDFSSRSIDYAREQARLTGSDIDYVCGDYLAIDYRERFDIATLIYCDYAPLSLENRKRLLELVRRALRPGGKFIFDVFTPKRRNPESRSWYFSQGGFWSAEPHLCLESVCQYDDPDKTELNRTVVLTEDGIACYNIWDHFFTPESLTAELDGAGFSDCRLFGDVAGAELTPDSETICCLLTR